MPRGSGSRSGRVTREIFMNIRVPSKMAARDERPFMLPSKIIPAKLILVLMLMLAPLMVFTSAGCEEEADNGGDTIIVFHSSAGEVNLKVEVARTEAQRSRGLMGRDDLPDNSGMIFIWDKPTQGGFWMKDTFIPLSIAFISADGMIIEMQDMAPKSLEIHSPGVAYKYAVEVNQGYFGENAIEIGDSVDLSAIDQGLPAT